MTSKFRDADCIDKGNLVTGAWYRGTGRNSHIALWNGKYFLTFGHRFDEWVVKVEEYWDDGGPFQPFEAL